MLPTQTLPEQQLQEEQESQNQQQKYDKQQQQFQQQQILLYQLQQQQQQLQEQTKPKTANYKIRSYSSQEQQDQAQIRQGGQTVFTNKVLSQAYRPPNGIQKRESSFVLDCQRFSNIEHEIYDPLKDGHLGSFFSNRRNKELLYRHKVLKRKGNNNNSNTNNILPRDNNLKSPRNKTSNNLTQYNSSLMLDQDIHKEDLSNNAHRRLPRLEKYFVLQNSKTRSNSQHVEGIITKEERVLGSQSQFEERQHIYGNYDYYDEHQGELLKQPPQGYVQSSQLEQYSFIEGAQRKAEMTAITGKQVFSQKQIEQQKQLLSQKAQKEDKIDGKVEDNGVIGSSQSSSGSANNIVLSPANNNTNNASNHTNNHNNNSKRLSRSKRGKSESNNNNTQRAIKNNYLIKPSQPPHNSPMNQLNQSQPQQQHQQQQHAQGVLANDIILQPNQIDINAHHSNTTNHLKINNNIYNSPFIQGNNYAKAQGVYGYLLQQQNQPSKQSIQQQQQALIQAIQKNSINTSMKQQKTPEKQSIDVKLASPVKSPRNNTIEQTQQAELYQENQQQQQQTTQLENNHKDNEDKTVNQKTIITTPAPATIQPLQQQHSRQLPNSKYHQVQSRSHRPSNTNASSTSPGLLDIYSKIQVLPYSPKNLNNNNNNNSKQSKQQPRTLKRKELPQLNKEQFCSFLEKFKSKCAIFPPAKAAASSPRQLNGQSFEEQSNQQQQQPISNQLSHNTEQVLLNQTQITQIQQGTL